MAVELRDDRDGPSAEADATDLVSLAEFILQELRLTPGVDLSIALVSPEVMADLNSQWMAQDGPTDVLSFPMDEIVEPQEGDTAPEGVLGDVVLCPDVANKQAEANGHSGKHEQRILLAHGILHLLGLDHADPQEEEYMFGRQRNLVATFQDSERNHAND